MCRAAHRVRGGVFHALMVADMSSGQLLGEPVVAEGLELVEWGMLGVALGLVGTLPRAIPARSQGPSSRDRRLIDRL